MIKILAAVWGFITGAIADAFRWLGKPGNKLKALCGVLAFAFALAGVSAFSKEQRLQEAHRQLASCEDAKVGLTARVESDSAKFSEIATLMRAEAEKIEAWRGKNAAEIERLADLIDAANKNAATWQSNYSQRPDECRAALEQLDRACPSLRGY